MAPASRHRHPGGQRFGAGATLILLVLGCRGDERPRATPSVAVPVNRVAADPAAEITTELDGAAPAFGDAVLAELTGDDVAARAGFDRVLAAPDAPAAFAARAALHLARIESRAGKSRHALDLVVRAEALAPGDPVIIDGVAGLRADAVAASGAGDIRGPRVGTLLAGVEPKVAEEFAKAERALGAVHKLRPRALIEALSTSIRVKEAATEDVVAKYRAVAEHGGIASVAGHYRAGSLYHDLALGLLFELPPELDPNVAAALRRTLRGRALAYLHKAASEYRASLAASPDPDAELWRLAAVTDLRAAESVLGEAR
jgi:hypothetical protein